MQLLLLLLLLLNQRASVCRWLRSVSVPLWVLLHASESCAMSVREAGLLSGGTDGCDVATCDILLFVLSQLLNKLVELLPQCLDRDLCLQPQVFRVLQLGPMWGLRIRAYLMSFRSFLLSSWTCLHFMAFFNMVSLFILHM